MLQKEQNMFLWVYISSITQIYGLCYSIKNTTYFQIMIWIPNSVLLVEFWLFAKEVFKFLPFLNLSSHSFHPLESTQKSMKDKTKET